MGNGFYLITGTSRGIGRALAQKISNEGNTVLGVSRRRPDELTSERYHHMSFDLSETSRIHEIVEKVDETVDARRLDFLCLVNNASATEPVGPIEKCPPAEIDTHVRIGLIAPMILSSLFMQKFAGERIRKKVAFISSGAAFRSLRDESVYCGSKAGLNMFAQCIGLEQESSEFGFEVVSIGPGMVDTSMQMAIRSKTSDEFAMADYFRKAFEDGRLQEPGKVAERIYEVLLNRYEQGRYIEGSNV